MRTEYLDYLLTVAQEGSISVASRKLHINHQALSKIIRNLENDFGTIIFIRSNSGVNPTAEGKIIIEKLSVVLPQLEAIMTLFKAPPNPADTLSGQLLIHSACGIAGKKYTDSLTLFAELYPHINVYFAENDVMELVDLVAHSPYHLGICNQYDSPTQAPFPQIPETLDFIPLFSDKIVIFGAKNHDFIKKNATASLKTLHKLPFVSYKPFSKITKTYELFCFPYPPPKVKYVVNSITSFFDILHKGTCLAFGNSHMLDSFPSDNIAAIPLRESFSVTTGLLIKKSEADDPLIQACVQFFTQQAIYPDK